MKNNSLEVLISCMNQSDISLVEDSKITTDVLMINQCDTDGEFLEERNNQCIRKIDVKQRGLSNSRNMAIENAMGDICLLCDDDEVMEPDYQDTIKKAFDEIPQADIIVFQVKNLSNKLKPQIHQLSKLQCLRVCSVQIAFRRKAITESGVRFDPLLGAGTTQGCGEENKFLLDCLKEGLNIYHYPKCIASIKKQDSTWFTKFDKEFFYQRGKVTGYMLGKPLALLYAIYYVFRKRSMYKQDCSSVAAMQCLIKGIFSNELKKAGSNE